MISAMPEMEVSGVFQFVGNIRRELPPVLFLCLFLRHVQHQNHSPHHIFRKIGLADGVAMIWYTLPFSSRFSCAW